MKQIILIKLLLITITYSYAQTLTVDPSMAAAIGIASVTENNAYSNIKSKQNSIEVLQTTTVATVKMINDWHKKMYNGLMYVSNTVKNAYQLVECVQLLDNIVQIENEMMQAAKSNPAALAFVVSIQKNMVVRAIGYYNDIQVVILKEGDNKLLMDAGQRIDLLNKVKEDLRCLRALAWMAKYKVQLVVMNGIIQTINPFAGIVNNDAKIVKDILRSWKY